MKPMPIEAIVMPSWQAERYSSMRSIWRERERGAALALVAQLLDARLARAHEGELRGDEEAVEGDQDGHPDQEQQLGHVSLGRATSRRIVVAHPRTRQK